MAGPTPSAGGPDPPGPAALLRVTVASATRRVDLVLPGTVPVAELLPELARSVGLLDPRTAHLGHRLRTTTGRPLSGEVGLLAQGVADGALLTVVGGIADPPPRRHDDLAEAVLDVVEHDLAHHHTSTTRRTALVTATLLLVLGALALLAQDEPMRAGAGAAGAAAGLLGGAVLLSRLRPEPGAALTALGAAVAYAVVAGVLLAAQGGVPVVLGGSVGAASAGLVGLVALGPGRTWAIPPVLAGLLGVAGVVAERELAGGPGAVAAVLLVLVVLGSVLLPRLALSLAAPDLDPARRHPDRPVDLAGVRRDVRAAHEILLALLVGVGLAVLVLAPVAVSLGAAGTALAVAGCLVVLLGARRHRVGAEVVATTVLGLAALLATAVTALVLHPHWRPGAAAALLASGVGVLLAYVVPGAGSVRRGRLGDLAETAVVLSLPPLLVVASGLSAAIRG
ncbi:type VII secretion integral membrane protein EccD [Nocardioides sp. dk4132]|uniref:EsaB/YukD family protein n=1 Tax=unclassified Nocardioides TaxID=2615069 RepID=UPI00129508B3|nr:MULTISPECIES: EsaB/YukD family protein [unclassified Nocardioides]MQW78168.1 type VII secretion integral membrane protein EccD [Nocardioides sp. dk4132]QGA06188.1 type VII secretion integral membrane protein EccD [Nocardioides sp. dk884]